MVYSYYDLMHKKTIRGYCCQDIVNGIVNTNWNDGPYIHSYYYMSNVECELRIVYLVTKGFLIQIQALTTAETVPII